MKPIVATIMAVLLLAATGGVKAQTDYRQRQLTMDDGLPSNSVRTVVQDERGFIWMGTDKGLCRYDGVVLLDYNIGESGSQQTIDALLPQGKDGLYVATARGVFHFSFATEQFEQLPLDLAAPPTSLATDHDGNLWIATNGQGIVRWATAQEQAKTYHLSVSGARIDQVYADADNQVWALSLQTAPHAWRLNKSKDAFQAAGWKSETPFASTCMLQTADQQRWIGTWEHGLMRIADDGTLHPMPAPSQGHCLHIRTLSQTAQGKLLVGCDDGLWTFDTREHTFQLALPQRFVYTATADREGGLWVGTYYGGVAYVSPIAHRFDATPGGVVSHFCEDRHGRIWVASDKAGIACYQKGQRLEPTGAQQQLQHLTAHALAMSGDDLWIGTFAEGVYVFSTTTGRLRHYEAGDSPATLSDNNASAILRDRRGRIWVGTTDALCRYQAATDQFQRIMKLPAMPSDIDEDAGGRLWISTQGGGLLRYDPDGQTTVYAYSDKDQATLPDNMVNCTRIDSEGTVWVGTQGGLCRYDADHDNFRRVRLDVPKQAVASIVEDQGVLWLAGDCGVLKYTPGKDVQRFTRHDGLVSEQFLPASCLKASDGRVFFGTIAGFNSFYPYKIKVNQLLPPVYITQLEVYNHPVEVGTWRLPVALSSMDKLNIYTNDQMFSLAFASLSYCSPEKNIYAYMLEGFDKEWHYVGHDHKATYTNLSTGTYTFRVRATNNDGIWAQDEARLTIVVHPPLWWSLPAKIAYVLLITGLLYLYLRFRLGRAERRHKKEMALLSEAKEREVRDARMEFFTMIAHEIRTPVSLIIGPLEQLKEELRPALAPAEGQPEPAAEGQPARTAWSGISTGLDTIDRNAHRLLELVNQLLDFRKVDQNPNDTDFAVLNAGELLRQVADSFGPALRQSGKKLQLSLPEGEPLTVVADREGLVKVVSNLLSNANKYTRDTIRLGCKLLPGDKQWQIDVSDNGHGIAPADRQHLFDPFFQTKGSKPGTGIGLSIVKRIVDQHHGTVSVESQPGQGTTFTVVLPTSQDVVAQAQPPQPDSEGPAAPAARNSAATTAVAAAEGAAATEAAAPASRPCLLIVDDNEEMLTFLVTSFMDTYEVLPARDGTEALKLLQDSLVVRQGGAPTSTIDAVLSDWMMQQMDGPELCNRIRQNPATRHLPFVLLTAKTDSRSKVEAMEAGVDMFVEKPFAVKYLEACLLNLLRRRNEVRA